jgi:hypothetical protein
MSTPTWTTHVSPTTGWLLIVGALLFWAGAVTPPYRQWMGVSSSEYLIIIGSHLLNWRVIHGLFLLGSVLTVAGLASLCSQVGPVGSKGWAAIAITLLVMGMTLWVVHIGYRLSVTTWAANELSQTGQVPALFEVSHRWMGILFALFMALTYLAIASSGMALLATAGGPRRLGWFAVVFGLIAVPGLVTPVFQPPLMLFIVPFCMGLAIVRA